MTPLDPDLQPIADAARGRPPLYDFTPAEARAAFDARVASRPQTRPAGMASEDVTIAGAAPLALRIYRPADASLGATIVFLHGGGYMLGGLDQMDAEASLLAEGMRSVVVSVDYRLAPESKLPAAFDDAVSALLWARDHIAELGGDASRLCIAGESAGANIAASAAIAMRDRGIDLALQLLIVPGPDFGAIAALEEGERDYPLLSISSLHKIAAICLPSAEDALRYPFSAARSDDLGDLPPAVIGLAGHCPTVGIGRAYAERLLAEGNQVQLFCFEDMFHPYFAFTAVSPKAMEAARTLFDAAIGILEAPQD